MSREYRGQERYARNLICASDIHKRTHKRKRFQPVLCLNSVEATLWDHIKWRETIHIKLDPKPFQLSILRVVFLSLKFFLQYVGYLTGSVGGKMYAWAADKYEKYMVEKKEF